MAVGDRHATDRMRIEALQIVDAQVHIWLPHSAERPWPTEYASTPHGPETVTAESVLEQMDEVGVSAAILVPPSFEGDRNDYAFAAAADSPDRFRVQARYFMGAATTSDEIRQDMSSAPGMRGVRVTSNGVAATWLADGTLDWLWEFAAAEQLPIPLYPWAATATRDRGELEVVGEIAHRYPALKLALDHYGVGQWVDGKSLASELQPLRRLGLTTSVCMKTSALATIAGEVAYDPSQVKDILEPLVDWFGPSRLFWGSDMTRAPDRYSDEVLAFVEAASSFGDEACRKIMGAGLREWLQW